MPSGALRSHIRVLTLFSWLMAIGCATRPEPVTRAPHQSDDDRVDASTASTFTDSAARLFRRGAPSLTVTVLEPLTISIRGPRDIDLRVSLDRLWRICGEDAARCEPELRNFVATALRGVTERGASARREQIMAVLRPRAYFASSPGFDATNIISQPLTGDLLAACVVDSPQAVRSLSREDLASLRVSREEALSIAHANLRAKLGNTSQLLANVSPGSVTMIDRGGYFESSRLLLTEDWAELAKTKGTIIVAVPAHDVVIVATDVPRETLEKLAAIVRDAYARAERPISPELFRWTNEGWRVIKP